jgi:hypothetical protein
MRDAAEAKAALQGMSDAVKAETAAEVTGSTQAATARQKDIVSIQQETQALSQLANSAKQTNVQLLYGGRNDMTQHLSDMAQELNYTTLLNRQKWLGFSSVQQAMSYRQQMYNLALLENKAHFAGYLTADQYLGFLQRETAQTAALSAAIRDRTAAIGSETAMLLAHTNALQGTSQTAGSLGEGLTAVGAYNAALVGLPDTVTTKAVLDDSQAMAQLAAYRAALTGLPHAERMDIVSAATRAGGVPLTPQRAAAPVAAHPGIDYASVNRMLSQAASQARPAASAPLALGAAGQSGDALSAASGEASALAASVSALSDKAAVSADAIRKFQDSLMLAAVDARALEQGLGRLTAAEQLLSEASGKFGSAQVGRSNRRRQLSPQESQQGIADVAGLQDITGALRGGEMSNAPRGYPLPAPGMRIVPPAQGGGEQDLWGALSKYMQPAKAAAQVSVEGGEQSEAVLDKIAVQMQWLDKEDARPRLDLEGGQQAVTEADLLARELAELDTRSRLNVGIGFEEVEQARLETEALGEDLAGLPREVDTVLVVESSGATREVRDYTRDIQDIEREVGTRADFEDADAENGLSRYLTALIEAVQHKYEFYASFDDTAAKEELSGWIRELEEARAQENRITAGMGGASGGGGGGGPPAGAAGAGDAPDPGDARAWEEIAKAMRDADQSAIDANRALYDVKAGLGGMADPAAKAASALKAEGDAAVYMGWRIGLLRTQVQLWSGVFGDTKLIGEVALWHILLDSVVEVLALWVPALATAAAGLIAFGAAGYQSFKEITQQWMTLSTVGTALNTTIPPLTDSFAKLQAAVRPQVYELLGDYLTAAGDKTGVLGQLINETGSYLDKFAAKVVVAMQSGGTGLQDFLSAGAKDLALIGQGFASLGVIVVKFIQATAITHIAEDLAAVGDLILRVAADVVSIVPTPVLALVLALHGVILWGGLAADAVGKVVIGVAGLAGKLPALSAGAEAVARALGATNTQLVSIARSSTEVSAVSDMMGAKASEEELAQLAISIKATGQSVEEFVASAGTTSAARLERFSTGLDDAGKKSVALGIAAGASDTQLAGMATRLGGTAEEAGALAIEGGAAAEAVGAGGGGLLAALGNLVPVLGNAYVDLGLLAAALVGLGVYLGTRADQTKQFTDAMGQAVEKASLLTVISTTVGNLAEVTTTLNKAQATGVGNASELAASQSDLSGKLQEELTHVGDVSKAYGTNFVGSLALMNAAGVTTNQLFTTQAGVWAVAMQQVKGLISGYQAMGQQMGAVGEDLNALNLQNSAQAASMDKLNQAYDAWTKTVGQGPSAFISMAQGFATFQKDAAAAGASMSGLSATSLTLQSDFQASYGDVESLFDAFRNDQALTGTGDFTSFVKDAVAQLIPMAGGSKEAAAQISALAQEAGGPATTSIKTLQQWVGNITDPLQKMYDATNSESDAASNLSQDAARLTNTLQQQLNPAMASAIFNAHGGQGVFNAFADALAKSGPSSAATVTAAHNVAAELLAVSGTSASAKASFVGFGEAMGLSTKKANALWAQVTALPKNVTTTYELDATEALKKAAKLQAELPGLTGKKKLEVEAQIKDLKLQALQDKLKAAKGDVSDLDNASLSKLRGELAKTASSTANLVKPGETDTILKSFKDGTFYEATFLAFIPQVQRGLEVMNHAIGQFFVHDIPEALGVTGHAFEAAWDGMVNWFTQSVPHALEAAWDTVSGFFDRAFTHDIPEAWDRAWNDLVSPVTHAFDSVKTWVSSNFDNWWKTHGSAVEAVWNAVWGQVRGDALAAWHFIESDATTAWHVVTALFTSGPAKQLWSGFASAGKDVWNGFTGAARAAWGLAVAGAKGALSNIEAVFKAGWAVVAALGKSAWDLLSNFIVADVKSAAAVVEAVFKVAWAVVEAAGKIIWDTLVLVINEFLDIVTGHWQTAWKDLQAYAVQVWNAIRTAGIQVWNALSSAATQVWNNIWNAVKTSATQVWNALRTGGQQAWSAIWHSLDATVIQPMQRFFTGTVPGWWNSLAGKWKSMWSSAWTTFNSDILSPIEKFFTSTLPTAMENSLKGGINHVIDDINKVIGFINAVTSVVGVHIGTISHLASGGAVRMAAGSVPGTGDEDGTHIIAMGGEYMLRKPARMALQQEYGPGFLDRLNQADSWLGAGSRGNAASQRRPGGGRYASGGGILGDIGNWVGDAASAVAGAATDVWHGISDAAGEVAKFGEKAVFNAMWTVSGAPAEKAMEALGTPGDMGASWLQQVHNGVETWMTAQTSKAAAQAGGPAGGATGSDMANGRELYNYLLRNLFGGNKIAAAGAAASIWGESSWNPFAQGTGGRGLIGWTPPSTISDADFKGGMATQLPAILRFVTSSGDAGVIAEMFQAGSVLQAANEWGVGVERFGINDVHPEGVALASSFMAGGGPVADAIRSVTSNLSNQEAMAVSSWLLTRMNPAGSDTAHGAYGAWLLPLARNKGLTQAQAQNPLTEARLVAPVYAKAVLGSTPAAWKATPAQAAEKAYAAASQSLGVRWATPAAGTLAAAWNAVSQALGPAVPQTTAGTSSASTAAYQAAAAQLYPDWEGALGPWHSLYALKQPKGTPAADWATWLAQRAVVQNRVGTASSYIAPLFTDLKANPQELTAATWSNADSSVRRWQAAMDVAGWAKSKEAQYYSPVQSNLAKLEPEIIAAANAWHQVWGTTHTPAPGDGSSGGGGGGTGTTGPGSGPGGGAGPTVIDLAPLITGGPKVTNAGDYGFTVATGGGVPALGSVAGMFSGGMGMAAGGVVPNLFVPGLSANLSRQLTAATSGQLPRTLSDAAGNRVGLHVDQLNISNPVGQTTEESIIRTSNRLAFLGGRGMI